jgi:Domain of unknown function (DUF4338)
VNDVEETPWTELKPPLCMASRASFVEHVRALSKLRPSEDTEERIERLRSDFVASVVACRRADKQALLAAGLVVADLAAQGWKLRVRAHRVDVRPPAVVTGDRGAEKARIRRQELVKRNAQLRRPSVQRFLESMERSRLHDGKFVSIFSLMRDGRKLSAELRAARAHLNNGWANALQQLVDPYLAFVSSEDAVCPYTSLRLMDVWRYFRHTWSNQYTNVPGRTMCFLVRDRAAKYHPIIGIGALSSPIMQIRERDSWIGWHPDAFIAHLRAAPTREVANWLVETVDRAIAEIYVHDLVEDDTLTKRDLLVPSEAVIKRLFDESVKQRRAHHRYTRASDLKKKRRGLAGDEYWIERARTHLFRSKRALALATYLRARLELQKAFGQRPTAEKLASFAATGTGSDTIRRVLRKAKGDRVGISVADITVCGAVQPYNAVLGGKLVAMLAASPEVVLEYRRRYRDAESEIASSVAGRSIVRAPTLVLIGTTSLYGVGSSQYNRIKIPAAQLGGKNGDLLRYEELGRSEAFGTSQYSEETLAALVTLVQQADAQRVNSLFGEGVSPKLRKVRQALEVLNLPTPLLLRHHRPRVVYAVSLIRNLREYLLGFEKRPKYTVPLDRAATATIGAWWRERWLRNRIMSDEVLEEVSRHALVHPVTHGARVPSQLDSNQLELFGEP